MPEKRPDSRELGLYLTISQVGLEMVVPVALGWLLDVWLGLHPWIIITGAILGLIVGVTHLVVILDRSNKTNSSGKDPP